MDVNFMETVLVELKALQSDSLGYVNYVFENLEDSNVWTKYIWCVRYPNWQCRDLNITDKGYLTYELHNAGIDKWYNGDSFVYFKTTHYQFINFIDKPTNNEINEEIIL